MNITKDEQAAITKYDLLYEQRMTRVESAIENVNQSLIDIKQDNKEFRNEFKEIRNEMRSGFKWLLTFMIGFSIALVDVMAKGFHWI
jgi:uncharacterized membrane protein YjjP (DUF1212 family)